MWGDTLEEDDYDGTEDFYNHQTALKQLKERKEKELARLETNGVRTASQRAKILKLKRKVVYTYEYSDESDGEKKANAEDNGGILSKMKHVHKGPLGAA